MLDNNLENISDESDLQCAVLTHDEYLDKTSILND